jgi:hypothetical protein
METVGLTVTLLVKAPVLQVYELAPETLICVLCPAQIVGDELVVIVSVPRPKLYMFVISDGVSAVE